MKDFGAVGDGVADDTDAFIKAIAKVDVGAILIRAGRYKITRVIQIKKSNIVFRGAGQGRTTLVFPKVCRKFTGLRDMVWPRTGLTAEDSSGLNLGEDLQKGDVIADADRGSRVLMVSTTAGLKVGQTIRLSMSDDASKSLNRHIYADE